MERFSCEEELVYDTKESMCALDGRAEGMRLPLILGAQEIILSLRCQVLCTGFGFTPLDFVLI